MARLKEVGAASDLELKRTHGHTHTHTPKQTEHTLKHISHARKQPCTKTKHDLNHSTNEEIVIAP